MKNLNEYPTPITDFVFAGWIESHPARLSHAKLERKLAACRDTLGFYADTSEYLSPKTGGCGKLYFDCGNKAKRTLSATAP